MTARFTGPLVLLFGVACGFARSEEDVPRFSLPASTLQVIVGKTGGWNSSYTTFQRWKRDSLAEGWVKEGPSWYGRVGMYGLAWGRGLHPEMDGKKKKEGDRRAPAGVFRLGKVFGYGERESTNLHADWPYHQVTSRDLWVDDVDSFFYNTHIRVEGDTSLNRWERSERMRLGSHSHSLKLFIHHNTGRNLAPGAGSAIFFHIWLHSRSRSYGCSIMSENNLKKMIAWLDPGCDPLYVVLPRSVYSKHETPWGLPNEQE